MIYMHIGTEHLKVPPSSNTNCRSSFYYSIFQQILQHWTIRICKVKLTILYAHVATMHSISVGNNLSHEILQKVILKNYLQWYLHFTNKCIFCGCTKIFQNWLFHNLSRNLCLWKWLCTFFSRTEPVVSDNSDKFVYFTC